MIRFLADENFNGRIIRGLRRRVEGVQVFTVQDAGLAHATDAAILSWAAENERTVMTHDMNTLVGIAVERVKLNQPMAGVVVVDPRVGIGAAIQDLALIATCADPQDTQGQIWYLPL